MLHDTLRRQFSYAYFEEKNIVTTVFFLKFQIKIEIL